MQPASQKPDPRVGVTPVHAFELEEAFRFLNQRPLHTLIMAGLLREHGPTCSGPRGTFYCCRGNDGELSGIALIGHATMFEVRTPVALKGFAELVRKDSSVRMIMGEQNDLCRFLVLCELEDSNVRRRCSELFYEFTRGRVKAETDLSVQRATLGDLDMIVSAHADMVFEETGVNPLANDADGFRQRCARRVKDGKVWALKNRGELIFKADVVAETAAAAYVEGVWVNPRYRREGYAGRCWSEFSRVLLEKWPSFCGFVNASNPAAHNFYEKMGGALIGCYDKVYV